MVSTQVITPAVWTETARNVATAGDFEIPSITTAEIDRNYIQDPRFTNPVNWSAANASIAFEPGAALLTVTTPSTGNMLTATQTSWGTPIAGGVVSSSWKVENVGTVPFTVEPRIYDGITYTIGSSVTIAPGAVAAVSIENRTVAGTYAQPRLWQVASTAGAAVRVTQPNLKAAALAGRYFDPVAGSGDPDLTASWVGTPDASAVALTAVLAATPVTGSAWSSDGSDFCIQSSRWTRTGSRSARMISNSATASYRYILINALPVGTYTVVIPAHLEVAQAAPGANARTVEYRVDGVSQVFSTPFPNAPGDHEMRLTFTKTVPTGTHLIMINQRVPRGDADLWIDTFTLTPAGAYTGPAFSGDTYSTDRKRYRWLDAPNASASVEEIMTVAEVSAPVYEEVTLTSPDDSITFRALPEFGGFVYDNETLQRWYEPAETEPEVDSRPNANGSYGLGTVYTSEHRPLIVGQYYGANSIEAKAQRQRLIAMRNEGNPIKMTVKDESGMVTSREVWLVDYAAPFAADFSHFTFDIDLIAPDPLRYGAETSASDGMPTQGSGLVWNLGTAPSGLYFDWGTPGNPGRISLTNNGGTASAPRIEVGGAGAIGGGFRVTEMETGRELTFARATFNSDVIIFDSRTQRAYLNGGDVTGLMTARQWFSIPKGATRRYQITPLGTVSGSPTITGYVGSAWE
jgi:hypothetical protein